MNIQLTLSIGVAQFPLGVGEEELGIKISRITVGVIQI